MEKERTVSAFEHENALMHYGRVNKRSMAVSISICITCIVIVLIFVIANTIREKNWTEHERFLVEQILEQRDLVGVAADGVYQQPNP